MFVIGYCSSCRLNSINQFQNESLAKGNHIDYYLLCAVFPYCSIAISLTSLRTTFPDGVVGNESTK